MSGPILSRREDMIGHITLNRPGEMNALSAELAELLEDALRDLASHCAAIVIRGAGGNFCAGADLKFVSKSRSDPQAMGDYLDVIGRAFGLIRTLPIPVVAAVEGYCLAGGFELLQACDFAVAAEDAVIGDGHVQFAQLPGAGGAVDLARSHGRQAALGVLLTGDRFCGTEAAQRGLVYRTYAPSRFNEGVAALAEQLSRHGREPLRAVKRIVTDLEHLPREQALAHEREACVAHVTGPIGGAGLTRFLAREQRESS